MKNAQIELLIRKALGLLPNRAILVCVVKERRKEKKEVILQVEGSERILILKQIADKLWVDDGGDLKQQSQPMSPREIGDTLIVIPTTHNPDCKRIAYWGYLEDLQRLTDPKPAFGSLASALGDLNIDDYDLSPPDSIEVAVATEDLVTTESIVVEDDTPVVDKRTTRRLTQKAVRYSGKPKALKALPNPKPVQRESGFRRAM